MPILYILNAAPLSLFPLNCRLLLEWWPITLAEAQAHLAEHKASGAEVLSALGHADLARIASQLLSFTFYPNRVNVTLMPGDKALVCQYRGSRLAEGATQLPEGALLDWHWLHEWSMGSSDANEPSMQDTLQVRGKRMRRPKRC